MSNSDAADTSRETGIGSTVRWVIVGLLIYVLSAGPAVRLWDKSHSHTFRKAIELIYAPVGYLARATPLAPVFEWYIGVWMDLRLLAE